MTRRYLSIAAVLGGAVIVALCLIASFWPRFAGEPVPRDWGGETLYLTADGDNEHCTVSPPEGAPPYPVTVPQSPSRGLTLVGTRLDPPSGGSAVLDCTRTVRATQGPLLRLYPLAENDPWVILPGVGLLAVGLVGLRTRRPNQAA